MEQPPLVNHSLSSNNDKIAHNEGVPLDSDFHNAHESDGDSQQKKN
jgi:hypothetical protein